MIKRNNNDQHKNTHQLCLIHLTAVYQPVEKKKQNKTIGIVCMFWDFKLSQISLTFEQHPSINIVFVQEYPAAGSRQKD